MWHSRQMLAHLSQFEVATNILVYLPGRAREEQQRSASPDQSRSPSAAFMRMYLIMARWPACIQRGSVRTTSDITMPGWSASTWSKAKVRLEWRVYVREVETGGEREQLKQPTGIPPAFHSEGP
jgi:hypothetical protein